ncbi:MAG: sulfatase-like hydrolase/transferase [FCB group bacterium]|nr:sulfatase-like hydrolase/transferase [FCB group bacterium]
MRRIRLIHPLLFGIFPVLFLYAQNAQKMNPFDIGSSLLFICISITIMTSVAGLILRNMEKGAVAVTILTILFFSYGHITGILPSFHFSLGSINIGPDEGVLMIYGLLLIFGLTFVIRTKMDLAPLSKILFQLGLLLVAVQIVHGSYIIASRQEVKPVEPTATIDRADLPDKLPDIYYIVMDAYGRQDILKSIYDVDNSEFIAFLRERGFYVADSSYSNYTVTVKSLAATMNLDYVQNIGDFAPDLHDNVPLARRLWNNEVFMQLENLGYTTVAFTPTGSSYTESMDADVTLQSSGGRTEFQNILMSTLPLPLFLSQDLSGDEAHRRMVLYKMEKIPKITEAPSPKFVFAHVFSPHKPFVFDPDGEPNKKIKPEDVGDNAPKSLSYQGQYIDCYTDQVTFITKRLRQTITEILELNQENPPIIIIQGDHGPRSGMDWFDVKKTNLKEVFSILNAMYLPGVEYDQVLNNDLSSINTFRIIFNEYFKTNYEMLPNLHYYTTAYSPFDLQPIKPEQLGQNRNKFGYLLENDFDSLPTLERVILLTRGLADRTLADCYPDGQPQLSYADGGLHLADSRIKKVHRGQYMFEAAFVQLGMPQNKFHIDVRFFATGSDGQLSSNRELGQIREEIQLPAGTAKAIGKIISLPLDPEKYTVSVFSEGQPIKSDSDSQPFFIKVKK